MINPAGVDVSLYGFIICALIAAVVSGVLAFIMTPSTEAKTSKAIDTKTITA